MTKSAREIHASGDGAGPASSRRHESTGSSRSIGSADGCRLRSPDRFGRAWRRGLCVLITLAASLQAALPAHGQCDPSQVGVPTSLAVATQPWISSASGVGLIQQPAVQVRDACGDPVLQAGIGVTASLASGTGTLGGTTTATTDSSGIATFTNLFITGAEGEYTIGFASSGLTGVTTHAISLVDSCELFVQENFLQNGVDGQVYALATLDGKLYVGGWFTTAGEARANYVAAWDPATSTWSSLGTGIANG
ncbi:MAG: hypothetical protein ACO3NL_00260, partial [Phycisphaerales bacterium]